MLKYSSSWTAAFLVLAILSACSRPGESARTNDSLTVGVLGDFQSLNPLLLAGSDTAAIVPLVFSYLVSVDGHGRLVPDLALEVPSVANGGVSPDGTTIVYRLRKGALWQDGAPLTSADVAYTYGQIMNPRNDVPARNVYDKIVRLDTPDERTVRIRLREPNSAILSNFFGPDGNYPVLPEHLLRRYADLNHVPFNGMPVGSGPFRVVEWARGDRVRLERFDRYFGGKPALRTLTLKTVSSLETLLLETRTHEIGATFNGSITQIADYRKIPGVRAVRAPVYGSALMGFNVRDPMVSDARVRRAIVEAADFARLVSQASHGTLTFSGAGRGLYGPAYDPSIAGAPPYDLADANRLLDAAGWIRSPNGVRRRKGMTFAPSFVYIQSQPEGESFGLLLQAQLQRAGIALTLRPYTAQVYAAPASAGGPIYGGKFQIVLLDLLIALDPSTDYLFGCSQMPPAGGNFMRYCNAAVDRANAASLRTYDAKQREADSATVQRQIAQDLPFVPIWQQANSAAYPANLQGVEPAAFYVLGNAAKWRYLPER
ncbi:MAG TPA: peptide ABC transporter substrate-binding protein [Candidatus Baltobacteraceae bacterium]|jgi:peptide/nickel transport system substrate-binding protein|nr:peptide ABC transporter substrate-binding protein [Candidatus Baltobacteraceae bacterium]